MFIAIKGNHYHEDLAFDFKHINSGYKKLVRLACSINYESKVEVLAEAELRGSVFQFFTKPKLLSWNVRIE